MALLAFLVLVFAWIILAHLTEDIPLLQADIICYDATQHSADCQCAVEHDEYCLSMERNI